MALDKQTIDIPIVGGLDDKSEERLSVRPTDVLNFRMVKTGGWRKRNGITRLTNTTDYTYVNVAGTAGVISTVNDEALITYRDGLYRAISGGIYAHTGTTALAFLGNLSGLSITQDSVAFSAIAMQNGAVANPTSGSISHLVCVCAAPIGTSSNASDIQGQVIDATNGAMVIPIQFLGTAADVQIFSPQVVACGQYAFVIYLDNTTIKYIKYDCTTATFGAATSLITSAGRFGVVSTGASSFAICYVDSSANSVFVKTYNTTPTNQQSATVVTTAANARFPAITYNSGDTQLWVAYQLISTKAIQAAAYNATSLASVAGVSGNINASYATTGANFSGIYLGRTTSTSVLVGWQCERPDAGGLPKTFRWKNYNTSNVITGLSEVNRFCPLTQMFSFNGRTFIAGAHLTNGVVLQLSDPAVTENADNPHNKGYIAGVFAPRQMTANTVAKACGATLSSPSRFVTMVPRRVVANGANQNELTLMTVYPTSDTTSTDPGKPIGVNLPQTTLVSGATLSFMEPFTTAEVGFLALPTEEISVTNTTGGSLTANSTYRYTFVPTVTDSAGLVHRGTPVAATNVTTNATFLSTSITVPSLSLTNHSTTVRNIYIEVYRTAANGTVDYYVSSITNNVSATTVTTTDTAADTAITGNRQLYTTGGVVSNVIPSGGRVAVYWKRSVFVLDTPDDRIFVSKATVEGEGPAFADEFTISPFEGGRCKAAFGLDDKFIIFKKNAIYAITGEPPDDLGNSTLSDPQRICSDVGCVNQQSIVSTQEGLIFQGTNGRMYLLSRGLQVMPLGFQAEDLTTSSGTARVIGSGCIVPYNHEVVFTRAPDSTANTDTNALGYDYYHGSSQGPVWTRKCYLDPTTGNSLTPLCATVWKDKWTFAASDFHIYQEDISGQYLDRSSNTSVNVYVPAQIKTQHLKIGGTQNFGRLWRTRVLGGVQSNNVTLRVRIWPDYNTDATPQSATFTYAASSNVAQDEVQLVTQKAEAWQFEVADLPSGNSGFGTGEGLRITGIGVDIGQKRGGKKLPAGSRA